MAAPADFGPKVTTLPFAGVCGTGPASAMYIALPWSFEPGWDDVAEGDHHAGCLRCHCATR